MGSKDRAPLGWFKNEAARKEYEETVDTAIEKRRRGEISSEQVGKAMGKAFDKTRAK